MDPIITTTSTFIIELAFHEFIKLGASEISKALLNSTKNLCQKLQDTIRRKFQGNSRAESALKDLEQQGTASEIKRVATHLDVEMAEDPKFSAEI